MNLVTHHLNLRKVAYRTMSCTKAMQTGTVTSELTGRVKKIYSSYKPMNYIIIYT